MIDYMRNKQIRAGYQEVNTPEILDRSLWEQSGHAEKFGENMYLTQTPDERVYAVKPMNCPGHIQVFKQGIKSYRDLPYYLAEFGKVHRYEPSGALHGILRVRSFTQDDAHLFCMEEQVQDEIIGCLDLVKKVLGTLGITVFSHVVEIGSVRAPDGELPEPDDLAAIVPSDPMQQYDVREVIARLEVLGMSIP